jgi:hypothetical protein
LWVCVRWECVCQVLRKNKIGGNENKKW